MSAVGVGGHSSCCSGFESCYSCAGSVGCGWAADAAYCAPDDQWEWARRNGKDRFVATRVGAASATASAAGSAGSAGKRRQEQEARGCGKPSTEDTFFAALARSERSAKAYAETLTARGRFELLRSALRRQHLPAVKLLGTPATCGDGSERVSDVELLETVRGIADGWCGALLRHEVLVDFFFSKPSVAALLHQATSRFTLTHTLTLISNPDPHP